jgi:hypothetical protein
MLGNPVARPHNTKGRLRVMTDAEIFKVNVLSIWSLCEAGELTRREAMDLIGNLIKSDKK